jgi:hypothetical protein
LKELAVHVKNDGMQSDKPTNPVSAYSKALLSIAFAALVMIGAWILFDNHRQSNTEADLARSNLDLVADVIREKSNRIEVSSIAGNVTTVRETQGGLLGLFDGKLVIRQPFRVGYFVDMRQMTLSDYIWDEKGKILFVRLPQVAPDPPNIDASKQEVQAKGWIITRNMQERLRKSIAAGARNQAQAEALKPEHIAAATAAAREAIEKNLSAPLRRAGLGEVRIEVLVPRPNSEHWDVSRSIAEVLAERAER